MRPFLFIISLLIGWLSFPSCQTDSRQKSHQLSGFEQNHQDRQSQGQEKKQYRKRRNQDQRSQFQADEQGRFRNDQQMVSSSGIPAKVYSLLAYVRQNKQPKNGYVGGRRFGNFENHLPRQDISGRRIAYQEWDVNAKKRGRNRGTERLVTGSDGRAWFTADHYNTFTEIK